MAKVRVHELAKAHDMSSQDVLDKLRKAGIKVKAPASAVDEDQAKAAIEGRPLPTNGAAAKPAQKPAPLPPA
ncbi:MAG TPA: translation initiation factor IF-2 N-terminal domain-containing protein, partial [Solirubrobacteraceae bacterium]|nr:translation initiation factor IF-2 N-terminal domain-containing protein [Solirubrobacteraceae bacterium]